MAGVFDITVTGGFCAAHRLPAHAGACAHVHGHNFAVTATLAASELPEPLEPNEPAEPSKPGKPGKPGAAGESGMVMDFLDLKAILDSVLCELDHKDLNALPEFQNAPPTAELLARHIFRRIKAALGATPASHTTPGAPGMTIAPVRLLRVEVRETKDFAAGYSED